MAENLEKEDTKSEKKEGLDEQTIGYFKRLKDFLQDDEIDEESRTLFIGNVFVEMEGKEILLSKDQGLSRIMEDLLKHLTTLQLCKIMKNISERDGYFTMCTDKFASHVMQTIVDLIPGHVNKEKVIEHEKRTKLLKLESLFLNFCEIVVKNLTEFITHTYASHVLRSVFQALSGSKVLDSVIRSRSSRYSRRKESDAPGKHKVKKVGGIVQWDGTGGQTSFSCTTPVPSTFAPVLQQFCTKILEMKQFEELICHPLGNPVLQTLLLVLSQVDANLCSKVCKAVMKQSKMFEVQDEVNKEDNKDQNMNLEESKVKKSPINLQSIPELFCHDIGSHLVEKVLQVAKPKLLSKLFSECFKGRLITLASHPIANYIIQHLLTTLSTQNQAELAIDELEDYIEDILAVGHMGVVVRMAELCARLKVKQKFLVKSLLKVFHCVIPQERRSSFVQLLTTLTTYDIFFDIKEESQPDEAEKPIPQIKEINYHGAMILKALLMFEENKPVVKSFMCLSTEELVLLACDQNGSFMVEAFFKSETVAQKKKGKVIKKLKGHFHKLACNRFGSHVIDTCWSQIDVNIKDEIASDLSEHELELSKDFHGRFVLRNCGIEHYKMKKDSWKEKETQIIKNKKLFSDILGEDVVHDLKPIKKKKKISKDGDDGSSKQAVTSQPVKYCKELAALGFGDNSNNTELETSELGGVFHLSTKEDEIDKLFSLTSSKKKKRKFEESSKD